MPSDGPLLSARGLSKGFGAGEARVEIFRAVSLEIRSGDFLAVTGPSGCGKSTLLHLFAGLEEPDAGTVEVGGHAWTGLPADRRARLRGEAIGFVFQFHHLLPELTAEENVALPLFLADAVEAEARSAAREVLGRVGLSGKAAAFPRTLSGGNGSVLPSPGPWFGGRASSSATSRRGASMRLMPAPCSTSSPRWPGSAPEPSSSSPTTRNGPNAVLR